MKYLPTKEEAAEHYKGYEGRNLKDSFAARLISEAIKERSAKILDCGSASGLFFRQLSELGFKNLYGLDIENFLDEENKKYVKELKTADCNSDKLPWPDNSFDAATAWCLLPHLENPHHFLREIHRLLKPNGLFILSIPHLLSRASVKYFLKHKDFARYHPTKNHITAFTPGTFQIAISRYFQKVKMDYLIDRRSLSGLKGKIRGWILDFSKKIPGLERYFKERWGYNQIWVLKKI